jgi:hypothetical protein
MVTQRPLEALFMVRIHVGQPTTTMLLIALVTRRIHAKTRNPKIRRIAGKRHLRNFSKCGEALKKKRDTRFAS